MGNRKNDRKKRSFSESERENLRERSKGSWFDSNNTPDSAGESASKKKIKLNDDRKTTENSDMLNGCNYIFNMEVLQSSLNLNAVCSKCLIGTLKLAENKDLRQGLVPSLYVICSNTSCSEPKRTFTVQKKSDRYFDINKAAVLGARVAGIGCTAVAKMFSFMGLPTPVQKNSWKAHQVEIAGQVEVAAEEDMQQATEELKKLKFNLEESHCTQDVLDVAVSFDGTWNHVGHNGSFCVVYAVSVDTGKVIDYEYRYKVCKICTTMESLQGTPAYEEWKRNHASSCTKTHDGSSSSMETSCVLSIYKRSIEKRGLRYTTFVGDGDSSTYRTVVKNQVYGPSTVIEKENCIGHVQKRMGTRLRKLLQELKGQKLEDGKGLSGRGRLTLKIVDSFQVFYGIALRSNKNNLDGMKQATRAILTHYASTPEHPNHDDCPTGEKSWCKWQVDKALGTSTYRFPKNPLPTAVTKQIEPIINQLSSEVLLKTVLRAYTQNPNEAIHSMLWNLVSKRHFNSDAAYKLATAVTVGHWNSGQCQFNNKMWEKNDLKTVPESSKNLWRKLDKKRIADSMYKNSDEQKDRRKEIRKIKLKMEDAFQKAEEKSYDSGSFLTPPVSAATRCCKTCQKPMKGHKRGICNT